MTKARLRCLNQRTVGSTSRAAEKLFWMIRPSRRRKGAVDVATLTERLKPRPFKTGLYSEFFRSLPGR